MLSVMIGRYVRGPSSVHVGQLVHSVVVAAVLLAGCSSAAEFPPIQSEPPAPESGSQTPGLIRDAAPTQPEQMTHLFRWNTSDGVPSALLADSVLAEFPVLVPDGDPDGLRAEVFFARFSRAERARVTTIVKWDDGTRLANLSVEVAKGSMSPCDEYTVEIVTGQGVIEPVTGCWSTLDERFNFRWLRDENFFVFTGWGVSLDSPDDAINYLNTWHLLEPESDG